MSDGWMGWMGWMGLSYTAVTPRASLLSDAYNGIKVACGGSCFWTFQNAITFKYFRFPLEVRTSAASVYWNGQNQAEMLGFAGLEFWYQVNLDIYRISDLNFVKIGLCCQRLRETHIRVVKHATSQSKTCWSLLFTGTWRVSIKHVKCI